MKGFALYRRGKQSREGRVGGESCRRMGECVVSPLPVKQHHHDSLVGGRRRTEPCVVGVGEVNAAKSGQCRRAITTHTQEAARARRERGGSGGRLLSGQKVANLDVLPCSGDL